MCISDPPALSTHSQPLSFSSISPFVKNYKNIRKFVNNIQFILIAIYFILFTNIDNLFLFNHSKQTMKITMLVLVNACDATVAPIQINEKVIGAFHLNSTSFHLILLNIATFDTIHQS